VKNTMVVCIPFVSIVRKSTGMSTVSFVKAITVPRRYIGTALISGITNSVTRICRNCSHRNAYRIVVVRSVLADNSGPNS